jgi:UDP-N-acetyl-alpha-D-muramoyl-L-alanyl-L-glutamate epimerase
MTSPAPESAAPRRGQAFRYDGYDLDPAAGALTCRYTLDGRGFTERVAFPGLAGGDRWDDRAVGAAARWVFLLAGVSYYKTAAPPVIELPSTPLDDVEREFLRSFYLDGLGEYAYRNGLDLTDLRIDAPNMGRPEASSVQPDPESGLDRTQSSAPGRAAEADPGSDQPGAAKRPLIPFGGGIDSIVTVELIRPLADAALFVVDRPRDRFVAIERPAAVSGLPVVRAEREIDPQVLRSNELGFLNGHVPVTGIISAIGVMAAVLDGRDALVMSNEWSSSVGNLVVDGRTVNHQWSKSLAFESGFRTVLAAALGTRVDYFSRLRPYTELFIAERFAQLGEYHLAFQSCNRGFHIDPARRLDHWCGQCDKCCFIDLILAPFIDAGRLREVFGGHEPLDDPTLLPRFQALVDTSGALKPWECVGEVNECRAAVVLAAQRPDRADTPVLRALGDQLGDRVPTRDAIEAMLHPVGEHHVPDAYTTSDLLD